MKAKIACPGPFWITWAAVMNPQDAVQGVPTAQMVPTMTLQNIMKKNSMKLNEESDLEALKT